MPAIKGNTSTTATLAGYNIPATIKSFILANKHGSPITVTVSVAEGGVYPGINITAQDYTLLAGQAYIRDIPIRLMPETEIYIETTNSLDYYFTIE